MVSKRQANEKDHISTVFGNRFSIEWLRSLAGIF